jgi:hypothetical protein
VELSTKFFQGFWFFKHAKKLMNVVFGATALAVCIASVRYDLDLIKNRC